MESSTGIIIFFFFIIGLISLYMLILLFGTLAFAHGAFILVSQPIFDAILHNEEIKQGRK